MDPTCPSSLLPTPAMQGISGCGSSNYGTEVLKGSVTVKRSGFLRADEQVFKCFPALAEELIPKPTLHFWLVSGITQSDSISESQGSQEFGVRIDNTHPCRGTGAHVHSKHMHTHMYVLTQDSHLAAFMLVAGSQGALTPA